MQTVKYINSLINNFPNHVKDFLFSTYFHISVGGSVSHSLTLDEEYPVCAKYIFLNNKIAGCRRTEEVPLSGGPGVNISAAG